MDHPIPNDFLTEPVKILVVGAGGTGSQMVTGLARLHHALKAFGHPGGLDVTLIDDDTVSETNLLRQSFYPCDIGLHKAPVIINRVNMGFSLNWESRVMRLTEDTYVNSDIIIGCVDTRAARKAIKHCGEKHLVTYWLDCGNKLSDGQVILGEFEKKSSKKPLYRLPTIADLYPDLIDPSLDEKDETPSCSMVEALEKQSLFINSAMTLWACNLLFELFRYAKITHHGNFINLKSGRTNPLAIDELVWQRMGYECQALKQASSKTKRRNKAAKQAA